MAFVIKDILTVLFVVLIAVALGYITISGERNRKIQIAYAQVIVNHGLWCTFAEFDKTGALTLSLYDAADTNPVYVLSFAALHPVASTLHQWVVVQGREIHTIDFALAGSGTTDEFTGFDGDLTAHLVVLGKGRAPVRFVPQLA